MLTFLITVVKLILALCAVAVIHELGHFLIAKLFKTQVNEFSIGFGPKIIQKKYKDTMYSLRWLPFGGYVSIEGEADESEGANSFRTKNTPQKLAILFAGALFNAILAVVIFLSVTFQFPTYNTKIVELSSDSVLTQAQLMQGDTIKKINGVETTTQMDLLKEIYVNAPTTKIEYERNGLINTVTIDNAVKEIGYIGVIFKVNGEDYTNQIEMIESGKAAFKAGLKVSDKILAVNGIETLNSSGVIAEIRKNPNRDTILKVERGNEIVETTIVPAAKKIFDLGIYETESVNTTLKYAWKNAYYNVSAILGSYVDLFKGKVQVSDMSGIVGIGEVVSKTNGFLEYLNLVGIISLAIGAANLMPFPPLDGGKMVIVLGEAITRKKMPLKVEAIISYIGFGLLILLSIFVTYNDILRVF